MLISTRKNSSSATGRTSEEEQRILREEDANKRMRQTATPEAPEITISEWASKPSAPNMSAGGGGTGAGAGQGAGGKYGSTDEKGGGEKPEQVRAINVF